MIIKQLFFGTIDRFRINSRYYDGMETHSKERIICDYISGMTDSFALSEYQQLFS